MSTTQRCEMARNPPPPRLRRQLLGVLPRLTVVYDIKPWEVDLLTDAEVSEYLRQLPEFERLRGYGVKEVADDGG